MQPGKKDPNRTRITICGRNVCYPGDVGTNTASLELVKLMINSVLSRAGGKYVFFDNDFFHFSICENSIVKNSSRIHLIIQTHQLGAQRMDIF